MTGRTMSTLRKLFTTALSATLVATAISAVLTAPAGAAAGPSVPLPDTSSTPVSEQKMGSRGPDQATTDALKGNQPASGGAREGSGNSKASPLSPSATWNVSAQTGDFSWSYPLRVPPAAGGLTPELALSYASSDVDGRTSATNNQASWAGDGWSLGTGFVERTYGACAEDTAGGTTPPERSGDLCWRSDNAVASYGGGGGQLILDDKTGRWRAKNDDGARIERLTGAANGDDNGEHWRVTTVDGTQYLFGSRPSSSSTWTVPVFGDDVGEPCHAAPFGSKHCVQAWRWNLDKVVDRHGNVIVYDYTTESNSYGLNGKDTAVSYVRGGWLKSAEYGLREGSVQKATGRVEFSTADRCVPGSDCVPDKKDNWPDVPWDDKCDTATCKDKPAPTFWTTQRLAGVTTKVLQGDAYQPVDSWTLDHQFPAPGDGEKAALWLKSIIHKGRAGTEIALPPVTFEGTKMPNRVEKVDGLGPLIRYRVSGVVSEAGGVISIVYARPDCADGSLPANPETNTKRCFPMRWAKKDFSERTDHFHKYVVEQVVQSDRIAANAEQVTRYEYLGGAAWAYDKSEFTKEDKRTWNEFRGFGRVRVRKGVPNDPSGPVTMTEQLFYRGMDGDKQPNGTRSVAVEDSEGGERTDDEWLAGQEFESQVHDGESEKVVSKTISTPFVHGPTATRGIYKAYMVRQGTSAGYTALASGGWRKTKTEQSYDDAGLPVTSNDLGDLAVGTDNTCTRTSYVRNNSRWLLDLVSRTETVAVACTTTPTFPADAISDTRTAYDSKAFGEAPETGNATRVEELDQRPASGPLYTLKSTSGYDALGRVISSADALNRTTTTRYVPETGGPVTQVVVTNPAGHTTSTTLETSFGQPVLSVDANNRKTETAYDALGRRTEVWLPNRARASGVAGNSRFSYAYRNDATTSVTTTTVGPNGNFTSTVELFDGLLRQRQLQAPTSGGGRLIVDTRYDSQGRKYKATMPYFADSPVDDKLWIANDVDIPSHTFTEFDGASRPVAAIVKGGAAEKWRTTTRYDGDRVHVTPPQGGTATTTISDAHGRVTELRQYHGTVETSQHDKTTHTYTAAGERATTTDPAGSVWRTTYDLHGRVVKEENPDRGASTMTYDAAGQLLTTTDARGSTLTRSYDVLGRKQKLVSGTTTLSEWTYDTVPFGKGLPATSTRYVDGNAYTATRLSYNSLNQPLGAQITIPQSEKQLAGTYPSYAKHNPDGSQSSKTYAAIGSLPSEAVQYSFNDNAQATTTTGGWDGRTDALVTATEYTRYGELARTQLGETGGRVWLSRYYDAHTRQLTRSIVDAEVPQPMQTDTNYTYDPAGNIRSIVDKPTGKPVDTQCFRMDHLQRITEAWTPSGGCDQNPGTLSGPAPYWHSYTYDKVGNRLTETQHAAAGDTVRTATFPAPGGSHQIKSVETRGPSGTKTDQFSYDKVGNTTGRGSQVLDWDAEGHLTRVTDGGKVTEFVYDADGNRLLRKDPTATTVYLDGQELRLVKDTGELEPTRYYQHGGETVAMRDGSGLTWLGSDHQSTAQVAVDSDDLTVTRRRQLPFGGPRGAATFPGEKGFVGGTIDASVGLVHLGAREYDPALGRFLSVDPVMDASDPQQMHGYTYANNSPITKLDPTGLFLGGLGKMIKKGLDSAAKWVDDNKNWIGVGLNVLGFVPGLGTAAFVLSTALTVVDLVQSIPKGDGMSIGFAVAGLGLGVLGRGLANRGKALTANRNKWDASEWKSAGRTKEDWDAIGSTSTNHGMAGKGTDAFATYVGTLGAVKNDERNAKAAEHNERMAQVRSSGWDCHNPDGLAGPYPCVAGFYLDPLTASYCSRPDSTHFCEIRGGTPQAKLPKRYKAKKSGAAKAFSFDRPPPWQNQKASWGYMSKDGLHHRPDGRGLAWF